MKLTSCWLDTSPPFEHGPSKPLEGHHDVAVVGGGLTGSSAALALATKGARMSTLMGSIMADVMDGRPELNPRKDFSWPAGPGYFGGTWFLPILGAYYWMKDLVT